MGERLLHFQLNQNTTSIEAYASVGGKTASVHSCPRSAEGAFFRFAAGSNGIGSDEIRSLTLALGDPDARIADICRSWSSKVATGVHRDGAREPMERVTINRISVSRGLYHSGSHAHFPNPIVARIGYEKIALGVHGHAGRII
jgi:hypothetical protein